MSKMKIYELAKEVGKQSKEIVTFLNDSGFSVKSHMSNIEDNAISEVKKHYSIVKAKTNEPKSMTQVNIPKDKTSVKTMQENRGVKQNLNNNQPKSFQNENQADLNKRQAVQATEINSNNNRSESASNNNSNAGNNNSNNSNAGNNNRLNSRPSSGNSGNRPETQNSGSYNNGNNNNRNNSSSGNMNNNNNSNNNSGNMNNSNRSNNNGGNVNSYNRSNNNGGNVNSNNRSNNNGGNVNSNNRSNNNGVNVNRSNNNGGNVNSNNRSYNNGGNVNSNNRSNNSGGNVNSNNRSNNSGGNVNSNNRSYNNAGNVNSNNRSNNSGENVNSNNRSNTNGGNMNNNNRNNTNSSNNYRSNNTGGNNNNQYNSNRSNSNNTNSGSSYNSNNTSNNGGNNNNRSVAGNQGNQAKPRNTSTAGDGKRQANRFGGNNRNGQRPNRINQSYQANQKRKDPNRKGAFIQPVVQQIQEETITSVVIPEVLTMKELADKMKMSPAAIVKKLFLKGIVATINQELTFEEAEEIALEFDIVAELEEQVDVIEELLKEEEEDETDMTQRPPVVCVMGHVDHGKTSLLDAIRKTSVTEKEAGGITQQIGAYVVKAKGEGITFLDTPGHEAFTAMRMRGANATDIAILVVAADDGVMPQTIEAINHAKAAGIQIIVAINKIDKPSANIERVKQELMEYELVAEDWGGSTIFVPVSAHTGEGIEQLLEMILLTAEICELKSNPNRKARGIVIEAELDKGRGPVATILVQKGTMRVGDSIAIGSAYGKVRAMMDDKGRRVKEALPSTPIEILGLNEVPAAGEVFMAVDTDKEARNIAETYIKQSREKLLSDTKSKLSLDGLFSQIQAGNIKELNLVVKADVQGSVEAVKQSLLKLSNEEVAIRIIHGGVGAVNESDVILASASNAIIIGFNVRPDSAAKETAERENVDLRLYRVIYNAIEDIEAAMKGMLDPIFEEKVIGHAQVRQVFKASGLGTIAGSYILDGKIVRGCKVRVSRGNAVIFDGELASLKRFKDDVKEVASGYECGLVFEKFNDVIEEDMVEAYVMVEVPR